MARLRRHIAVPVRLLDCSRAGRAMRRSRWEGQRRKHAERGVETTRDNVRSGRLQPESDRVTLLSGCAQSTAARCPECRDCRSALAL